MLVYWFILGIAIIIIGFAACLEFIDWKNRKKNKDKNKK